VTFLLERTGFRPLSITRTVVADEDIAIDQRLRRRPTGRRGGRGGAMGMGSTTTTEEESGAVVLPDWARPVY
jgi:hypothetical protein